MKAITKETLADMCRQARDKAGYNPSEAGSLHELVKLLHFDLGREQPGLIPSSDTSVNRYWHEIEELFTHCYKTDPYFEIGQTIRQELLQKE